MEVLICGVQERSGDGGDDDGGDVAEVGVDALADAWMRAADHCTMRVHRLAGAPPGAGAAPPGVLVPVESLGLRSARVHVPPDVARLREAAGAADLVVVHVPELDAATLHGVPVGTASAAAAPHAVPVVVLANRVTTTRREWSAAGISGVHELGPDGAGALEAVARAARTWAPAWAASSRRAD